MGMRSFVVMVLLVGVFGIALAQEFTPGVIENELIFIITSDLELPEVEDAIANPDLQPSLSDLGFELVPVIFEEINPDPEPPGFPDYNRANQLLSLGGGISGSPCAQLIMGRLRTIPGVGPADLQDPAVLQAVANLLDSSGVATAVLGVGGEGAHGTGTTPGSLADFDQATQNASSNPQAPWYRDTNAGLTSATGGGVIVAVLDTGFVDFGNDPAWVLRNESYDFLMGKNVVDDIYEEEVMEDGEPVEKNIGHGSPVAEVIHIIAPEAQILPIRICEGNGSCRSSLVIVGMCYAANILTQQRQDDPDLDLVINLSLSGPFDEILLNPPQPSLHRAMLRHLTDQGIAVAAAVGNHEQAAEPVDLTTPQFPAAFSLLPGSCQHFQVCADGLVATTALQSEIPDNPTSGHPWQRWDKSPIGDWIEIAAPGINFFVGDPLVNGYAGGYNGTSFATPMVAGTLALMFEAARSNGIDPSPAQLEECLFMTTQPPQSPSHEVGFGMLDIPAAVDCAANP